MKNYTLKIKTDDNCFDASDRIISHLRDPKEENNAANKINVGNKLAISTEERGCCDLKKLNCQSW